MLAPAGERRGRSRRSQRPAAGPSRSSGARTRWHAMRSPVYDVMPVPIWRLSGLDRNCLSAITHLIQSRHARRRSGTVPHTTIPGARDQELPQLSSSMSRQEHCIPIDQLRRYS